MLRLLANPFFRSMSASSSDGALFSESITYIGYMVAIFLAFSKSNDLLVSFSLS